MERVLDRLCDGIEWFIDHASTIFVFGILFYVLIVMVHYVVH